MDLFGWLRRKFADAVVGGIGDGLHSVGVMGDDEAGSIDAVRLTLARHLAPPREDMLPLEIAAPATRLPNGRATKTVRV